MKFSSVEIYVYFYGSEKLYSAISAFVLMSEYKDLIPVKVENLLSIAPEKDNCIVVSDKLFSPEGWNTIIVGEDINYPIRFGELLELIKKKKAVIENQSKSASLYKIGVLEFDLVKRTVINSYTDEKINLTEKESMILSVLVTSNGNECSKEFLLEKIWGFKEGIETHTLETHIYGLRKKIEKNPSNPSIILSTTGGYAVNFENKQSS